MTVAVWLGFLALVVLAVVLDLCVIRRRERVIHTSEALAWTLFWVALAVAFDLVVWFLYGEDRPGRTALLVQEPTASRAAVRFLCAWLAEKSLAVGNVYVIALILACYRVPLAHQHRVLFWGILGAVLLRGPAVASGGLLIARYEWTVYVFGGLLLATAVRMAAIRRDTIHPEWSPAVLLAQRVMPVSESLEDARFLTRAGGRRAVTPLLLALLLVASSDVLFAVDSVPAVYAFTRDPFLVLTSNVFAVLGLRAMYFALAALMHRLRYLKLALAAVLAVMGIRMVLWRHAAGPDPVWAALIGALVAGGIVASLAIPRQTQELVSPLADQLEALAEVGYRQARRVAILVLGASVLLVGVAMIVLPGPAFVAIPLGLAILGLEFAWARRWLRTARQAAGSIGRGLRVAGDGTSGHDQGSGREPGPRKEPPCHSEKR